jgi:hypothetical protein
VIVAGGWWLVAGGCGCGWWLENGGWWLVTSGGWWLVMEYVWCLWLVEWLLCHLASRWAGHSGNREDRGQQITLL